MQPNAFRILLIVALALAVPAFGAPKPAAKTPPSTANLAPDFQWEGAGGKPHPLKQLRGQPVVLLIAPSPDAKPLRSQAEKIAESYLDLSARKAVFVAAFTAQKGRVESDVPYAIAQDGAKVAALYGVSGAGFAVVVIGPDGNVDMKSDQVEAAQRIVDIINNSFQLQTAARTGLGG